MEKITTEEFMEKIDIFQVRFRKLDQFGWWDFKQNQTNAGMQFTSMEFQKGGSVRGIQLTSTIPEHQERNGQFEVTW